MKKRASIAFGFLALIVLGAVALASPWARNAGTWGDLLTPIFTACSAVCVTGLTITDIAREYSLCGQIILVILVELGCLGLMTSGTFLMIAIGRRLSLAREFSLMNAYGVEQVRGLRGLICWVIGSMLTIEAIGTCCLNYFLDDWWHSIFFSVMAFCNAGFSLLPDSIANFADQPLMLLILALETILGGIGFLVIYNLCTYNFHHRGTARKGRLSLHTKVVLRYTAYLLVFAFIAFLFLEWDHSLGRMMPLKKIWVGFYQAVTPRTCGFSVIPTEDLQPLTRLIYEALMFIGGGPGSAAAGMKLTTFAVLIHTMRAMCRGESETVIYNRIIDHSTVRESLVIFMSLVALTVVILAALTATETGSFTTSDAIFFEAVSAMTTTGLSMGSTTAGLSFPGKIVIMIAMFIGRLGALTVVMMIGDREVTRHIRYPNEELVVG